MPSLEPLRKISPHEAVLVFTIYLASTAPGVLLLYLYRPILFFDVSSAKIAMLAFSLTAPLLVINIAVTYVAAMLVNEDFFFALVSAGLLTIAAFYPPMFAVYLGSASFSMFLGYLVISELVLVLIYFTAPRFLIGRIASSKNGSRH